MRNYLEFESSLRDPGQARERLEVRIAMLYVEQSVILSNEGDRHG